MQVNVGTQTDYVIQKSKETQTDHDHEGTDSKGNNEVKEMSSDGDAEYIEEFILDEEYNGPIYHATKGAYRTHLPDGKNI